MARTQEQLKRPQRPSAKTPKRVRTSERPAIKKLSPPDTWTVLEAYSWNADNSAFDKTVFQIDNDGNLNPASPLASNEIEKIDRYIFYTLPPATPDPGGKPEPLLILDTIPDDNPGIIFEQAGGRKTITIKAKIRTVLMAREFVDITVRLEQRKSKDPVKYQVFTFFESGAATKKNILETAGGLKSLDQALRDTNEGAPFIASPGSSTFAPRKLRDAIKLSLAEDSAASPCTEAGVNEPNLSKLQIFFVRLGTLSSDTDTGPFLINYGMIKQDGSKCANPGGITIPTTRLKIFGDTEIEVDANLLRRKVWKLLQRPSINLTTGPKPPPEPDQSFPASLWVLQVHGVPAKGIPDLWNNQFAQPYYNALNIVQSGRPVSFLPFLDDITDPQLAAVRWAMSYSLKDATDANNPAYVFGEDPTKLSIAGLSLQPSEDTNSLNRAALNGTLRQLKDHDDAPLTIELHASGEIENGGNPTVQKASQFEKFPGILLRVVKAVENTHEQKVRMGALDLQFANRQTVANSNQSRFSVTPQGDYFSVHIEADFSVARVGPGGQDDLPGEEFVPEAGESFGQSGPCVPDDAQRRTLSPEERERVVERNFRRKSPLVIVRDFTAPNDHDKFLLHVSEHAQQRGSQTIRLNLQNASTGAPGRKEQVIILDRNPFLVALVEFVPFSKQPNMGGSSIGNWTNAGLEGVNWQLRTGSAPFDLVLPPQGVGEEMEKSKTIKRRETADFRFARPARVTLDPSFFQQNFTEAPWNLRRILGYPGQRSPGPAVKHIQFELLYGLSCDVSYPFLRLAEISALIGGIPGRLPRDIRWPAEGNQESCFQEARMSWSRLYRRYLSRVAILEPWDTHRPESLTISEGLVCRIRATSTLGMSNRVAAELQNPVDELSSDPAGLRGGVTWGFESRNVYNAVMKNPPAGVSTSASLSEPYFSSLGAWGRLQSSFDHNRSTIYADASMGRTYYYKLERIGRIACWWNKAKHVIVYERTVVPSRQFKDQQERHEGTAIVRKVKEYVEILEKTRSYPDGEENRTQHEEDELKQQRGCVADCAFEEGSKFAVQSSWGSDVRDIGWKVPIWNPGATPADVYPKPNVKFGLYSNIDGKSVVVPRRCKDPQNIFFYTDTRKETGSNPNDWPPIKDVDYCDLPRPEARLDFQDGKTVQSTPDDPSVHPGFAPCTFTLEPTTVPADVVAARAEQPLAAVLDNITMMRAAAIDSVKADAAHPAAHSLRKLTDKLAEAYAEILQAVPKEAQAITAARDAILNRVNQSFDQGKFKNFTADLERTIRSLDDQKRQLEENILNREKELFSSLEKQVREIGLTVSKNYEEAVAALIAQTADVTVLKRVALNNLTQQMRALQESLMLLRASPGMLQKLVKKYADAANRLVRDAQAEASRVKKLIDERFNDPLTAAQLNDLRAEAHRIIRSADELARAIRTAGQRRPEEWIPDPTLAVIKNFLGGVETEFQRKRETLERDLQAATTISKARAKEIISILDRWDETKITQLLTASKAYIEEWLKEIVNDWVAARESELRAMISASTLPELQQQIRSSIPKLKAFVSESAETQHIFRRLRQIEADLLQQSNNLKGLVLAEAAELEAKLRELQRDKVREVFNSLNDLRARIENQRDEYFRTANDYVDKNIRRLLPVADSVYTVADPAIRIVRAFGRPPEVPNLSFQRPAVAYFYKEASKVVDITPVLSRVRQASEVLNALKPVGVDLPTEKLLEKLVPPDLSNFKLSDIFPNFAGLDLSNLFSGLKMPKMANDKLRITHGADAQTGRAWVEANIDITTEEPATVFSFGPVTLRLPTARFQASARFDFALNEPPRRTVSGVISGDWELTVAGMKMVIFRRTEMRFDDAGGLRFGISPNNVELPGVLAFVSDLLSSFAGSDTGFSVGLLPTGVKAQLILPIPDIQGGTSGISNLTLGIVLMIQFADPTFDGQFTISLSFLLARKEKPFTITIFILGGGGYIDLTTTYAPSQQRLVSAIEVGITAGASLGLSLGPIHGSVYVFLGITARFAIDTRPRPTGPQRGLTFGVLLIIGGEVSILGIVTASVTLLLEVLYGSGRLIGHGRISIKIEICWCFTLEVEEDVTYEVGSGDSQRNEIASVPTRSLGSSHHAVMVSPNSSEVSSLRSTPLLRDVYDEQADIYINMLV